MKNLSRRKLTHRDRIIGRNLSKVRISRGLTQTTLGQIINVSYQQMQKYEAGKNKIAAAALWEISDALEIEITYFFTDPTHDDSGLEDLAGELSTPLN